MNFDRGRIQAPRLDADARQLFVLLRGEHGVQHAALGPAVHARIDGMPRTEALGQAAPNPESRSRFTGAGTPHDRPFHASDCHIWSAGRAPGKIALLSALLRFVDQAHGFGAIACARMVAQTICRLSGATRESSTSEEKFRQVPVVQRKTF